MKILYIHEYFTDSEKNGANIVAFSNYHYMKKNGNEVYFFAVDTKPYLEESYYNKYFPQSHIHKKGILNNITYRINSIYNFQAKNNLKKILNSIQPDIIHIHSTLELSLSILKPIKDLNIPIVITVHDAGFSCPVMGTKTQYCSLCSESIFSCIKNKCSKDNYFCSIYMAFKFFINKYLIKKYRPNQLIIPSKALANYVITSKFDNNIPITLIPNCLDTAFSKITPNYSNKKYFLFVGNLNNVKGVKILLQAIKLLPKEINFKIIGDGICEQEYKEFVSKNNLHNVTFCGKMNRSQLIEEYKNCIALITPSIWFEIFGMINIEAFACGKPVIASNIGGIPEIVEDNVNGLLFEPGNVEQLKECILKYWNNPKLVLEHGKNGYQKAITKYTEDVYYQKLLKLYEKTIDEYLTY